MNEIVLSRVHLTRLGGDQVPSRRHRPDDVGQSPMASSTVRLGHYGMDHLGLLSPGSPLIDDLFEWIEERFGA